MGKKYSGSRSHVWIEISLDLWRCFYCQGYFYSRGKPDEEAFAVSEEKARESIGSHTE